MQDNNDVVKESAESTTQETSTSSENQNTNNDTEVSSNSTSEVVKTQEGNEVEELVSQAQGEVKTDKGINRVQELANRAKQAELELQQLRELQAQQAQVQYGGQQPDLYRDAIIMQELRLRRMEEERQFDNAAKQYPELLDKTHPDYNPIFDDLVYNTYKNEGLDPAKAAAKVAELKKVLESKVAYKKEQNEAQKIVNSGQTQQRSTQIFEDNAYTATRNQFNKSGNVRDLAKMFELQKK